MLRLGSTGAAVAEVRARLAHIGLLKPTRQETTYVYDEDVFRAVQIFQQERGLTVNGMVGAETFRRLDEARWQLGDRVLSFTAGHPMVGDDVTELQRKLNGLGFDAGRPNAIFGVETDEALREFQRGVGVSADGICGFQTLRSFDRLSRSVAGGDSGALREHAHIRSLQTGIADKVIVIDPDGLLQAELTHAIAARVEGRLAALGTQVILTRPATPLIPSTPAQQATFANDISADLVISLHVDQSPSTKPNGIAVFYFGSPGGGNFSPAGKQLAELVSNELVSRTDRKDCRVHPRTWDLLRLTAMPAIRVDLGYMSNADDSTRLHSDAFQNAIALGVATALTTFCAPR